METEEKVLVNATLVFLVTEDNEVWLAKKAAKIGAGCWNGYGGGIEAGESKEESAIRETREESGVEIHEDNLRYGGYVDFHNKKSDGSCFVCRVHVFVAREWVGTPREIKNGSGEVEMLTPTRFGFNELPVEELMPADPFWLPEVLKGKRIIGKAWYGPFQKELLRPVEITAYADPSA
jgi:8-oxo-dGTP diphosphatase